MSGLAWNWVRGASKTPVTRIRITHQIDADDLARALCHWLVFEVDDSEYGPANMPTLTAGVIESLVRLRLANHGARDAENVWTDHVDDASRRDLIRYWAGAQFAAAWPQHAWSLSPDYRAPRWRDRDGDLWEERGAELVALSRRLSGASFPRADIEHGCGPLTLVESGR